MSEYVETPLQPMKIDKLCRNCQHGIISCVGQQPIEGGFIHECPECRYSEVLDKSYPHMIFKETAQ